MCIYEFYLYCMINIKCNMLIALKQGIFLTLDEQLRIRNNTSTKCIFISNVARQLDSMKTTSACFKR